MTPRTNQRNAIFPAGERIAWARSFDLLGQGVEQSTRFRILHQREHRHLVDFHHGPLRIHIEAPDRLDQIAEKLDADRLRILGRENIEDAAAQ